MSDYNIGLSGIAAARKALEVIGNNISNAATEGYHRQRIELTPAHSVQNGSVSIGGGVNAQSVARMVDSLLEQEILRQQSSLEYLSQESSALQTIETVFGELSTENGGLNVALDSFFNSLQELAAHPTDTIWQNQVLSDAESLAGKFRSVGEYLDTLSNQIKLESDSIVSDINTLTAQIADFNAKISEIEMVGSQSNSMSDQRDHCISELSKLVDVQILNREFGVVDVVVGGMPLVMSSGYTEINAGFDSNGKLGIAMVGENAYSTNLSGGRLGGLFSLTNTTIEDIQSDLDLLANSIITEINKVHVNGLGSYGSFTELTGQSVSDLNLSGLSSVVAGEMNIRVTNTVTGQITRHTIAVDPASDTLGDIASDINGITGLNASVTSDSRLVITSSANYKFDFSPAVLSSPTSTSLADASPPSITVTGVYEGSTNDTFKFTVKGDGSVGNGTLQLEIKDGGGTGNVIKTVNIGTGYAAGDFIDIGNGIKISLGIGNLAETDSDSFSVKALADSDTSGLLAAVGMNTFFSGSGASDMAICADIAADSKRIAVSIGPDMTDNANAVKLTEISNKSLAGLTSLTCGEFYRRMVTDIGQKLSTTKTTQDNVEVMVLNLTNRRSDISGVDINDEAAKMLIFEQMFQAMAKYMNTINETVSTLMDIL